MTALVVVAAGLATGVLSAMFGIGGGLLMVPFMTLALDRSQHVAEGTSLIAIVPTAAAGVAAHVRRGYVSFRHAALLAAGGIGGAFAAALVAQDVHGGGLRRLFGAFVALMGARLVKQGLDDVRAGKVAGPGDAD